MSRKIISAIVLTILMTCVAIAIVPDVLCYPPVGFDYMEHTGATIALQTFGPGNFSETITVEGPTNVSRSDPYDPGDGRIKIDTEIVSMSFMGNSMYIGNITVIESPSNASTGAIRQQVAGQDFPADSFFDVYVEIQTNLSYPLGTLHNNDPKNMSAVIYSIPPGLGSTYEGPELVYLYDENNSLVGAMGATRHQIGLHDVAVIGIQTSRDGGKPMMTIPHNMEVEVNVTVMNKGNFTETFDVEVIANPMSDVGSPQVASALAPNTQTVLSFTWKPWEPFAWPHLNYTIEAHAVPVLFEAHTRDNTLRDGVIRVVLPGNINGDEIVDIYDALMLAAAFGAIPASIRWNPNIDIRINDVIDIYDALALAGQFGQPDPYP